MEIRKVMPEERVHYSAICQEVFFDNQRRDIRHLINNPQEYKTPNPDPAWAVFEKGKMLSAATVHPFTIRMNGREVKMGGIGAVATRPEARGRGLIRRLYRPLFEEMRAVGQVYSFLYAFSYEYYRKFGYDLCYSRKMAEIPVSELSHFPYPERLVPLEPGDSHEPYARLYEAFARERNLSVVRSAEDWKRILNRDPYLKMRFTFLLSDSAGEPIAYVLYDCERKDHVNTIVIQEICWTTPEGLRGILGFLGKLGAEYRTVRWSVPDGVNIHALVRDAYSVKWEIRPSGMNRIVDVPAALAMHPAPAGSGGVTLGVTDAFCPENTGLYRIEWEAGSLTCTRHAEAFANADMETTVNALAQLVTGFLTPEEAQFRGDTALRSGHEALAALFPKKPLYILEAF